MIAGGAAAGLVAGARRAGVLRRRGLEGGWWIAAGTAIGWSVWAVLALMP